MSSLDNVIDAVAAVLQEIESRDEVVYAEVGGSHRNQNHITVRLNSRNSTNTYETSSVWWRLFSDGSAGYRHTTSLEESHLKSLIDRTIRSAQNLEQTEPESYDEASVHRATHRGWGQEITLNQVAPDDIEQILASELLRVEEHIPIDIARGRVTYTDESEENILFTTIGTMLQTTLERSWTESVLATKLGKVQCHQGSTDGRKFLENIPKHLEQLGNRIGRFADTQRTAIDRGTYDIFISERAAATIFHQLSHYLEIDMTYLNSSSFEIGDQIGPQRLTIKDLVDPGSFTARPYDAEGKPTQSIVLIDDGVVVNKIHDTTSAGVENAEPAGNVIPSIGHEKPPRLHARHLDVSQGNSSREEIQSQAKILIEEFGTPEYGNQATYEKRNVNLPPSTNYTRDIAEKTPSEFDNEPNEQWLKLPINVGYTLDGGERKSLIGEMTFELPLDCVRNIHSLSCSREVVSGLCQKNQSTVPWSVNSPAILLSGKIRPTNE